MKIRLFCYFVPCFLYVGMVHSSVPYMTMTGGVKMPAIGYGTFLMMNETVLINALNEALKVGYRHIDTAQFYMNEHVVGKVLKEWLTSGKLKREELFVTTKLHIINEFPNKVESSLKESLQKLNLDYVDLFLIHFPIAVDLTKEGGFNPRPTDLVGVWKKMEEQVDSGRTRTIGVSNFNLTQMEKIMSNARIRPANHQIELHPYYQQKEMRRYCKKHDIVVVAYSSLGAPGFYEFVKAIGLDPIKVPPVLENPEIKRIAAKHKRSAAQVVLRFVYQLGVIVIPKSDRKNRIKENFQIFDFSLDRNDMKQMKKLDLGPKGKIFDFTFLDPNIFDHPEYPFADLKYRQTA
ncbi:aldo-keto reductase family 1 member C15-like [Diabrotica virgifera virgifera]|uniref:NADP-dependent oxidoreductase domain-containing protein n=2 Tax=Diabrotica virgifera virgifera TaxID=50390 RepID=A0ABM5K5Q0_DIAVI|nr:aldo-keto reductase family 1 member C15-like [Diabrotica virgifera virgifera]XP_050505504.1 aldo-keto reductase family 1 member C15-like [Diabrotica virgifera virgifera]